MSSPGKTHWYVPDAYLPSSGLGEKWEGHECICVLNPSDRDATLRLTLYFADREPIVTPPIPLPARRDRHLGMHRPVDIGGIVVPRDVPYGIGLASDLPVIVQYSRLDVTQPNFTLMTAVPYAE
jgi:hypothetical protein